MDSLLLECKAMDNSHFTRWGRMSYSVSECICLHTREEAISKVTHKLKQTNAEVEEFYLLERAKRKPDRNALRGLIDYSTSMTIINHKSLVTGFIYLVKCIL